MIAPGRRRRRLSFLALAACVAVLSLAGPALRAGRQSAGLRRRKPEERARRREPAIRGRDRQKSDDLLRREFDPGKADRERRAGRYVRLGRPALDGLRAGARSDRAENPPRFARQQPRADRAEGQPARRRQGDDRDRAFRSPKCSATAGSRWPSRVRCRPAYTARRRSTKLGVWDSGRRAGRGRRERARGAGARRARRGAARHRLQDRRGDRAGRQDRRHIPGGHARADRLPDGADQIGAPRGGGVRRLSARPGRPRNCSRNTASRCSIRSGERAVRLLRRRRSRRSACRCGSRPGPCCAACRSRSAIALLLARASVLGQVGAQCAGASAAGIAAGRDRLCSAAAVRPQRPARPSAGRVSRPGLRVPLDRRGAGLRGDGVSADGALDPAVARRGGPPSRRRRRHARAPARSGCF